MKPAPVLTTFQEGRRLFVELDTPHSSVNVFGPQVAEALDGVMEHLPQDLELLVLRSRKLGSFVNGAGLLYAQVMRSSQAAIALSGPVREVYERLHQCPVPTVAVIEGNCFGCGLELALCCDVRVGRDVVETQFKMTELVDYRFIPLFGGTWRLPRTIGVAAAKRLLLGGETWDGRVALRNGLLDVLLGDAGFDRQLAGVLEALPQRLRKKRAGRDRNPVLEARPRRSGTPDPEMPPRRRRLWKLAARLLEHGVNQPAEVARAREVEAFARTVTRPCAKNAMSFFFVRHMARAVTLGDAERRPPKVALCAAPGQAAGFSARFHSRPSQSLSRKQVRLSLREDEIACAPGLSLLFPLGVNETFCELRGADLIGREAFRFLEWRGEDVVTTYGQGPWLSRRLLARTTLELRAMREQGVDAGTLRGSLLRFGFARPLPGTRLAKARASAPKAGLVARLAVVWASEVLRALEDGTLRHPSQGDVLVQRLFDFPVDEGALLRWLDKVGAERVERSARRAGGAPDPALSAHVKRGSRFYG